MAVETAKADHLTPAVRRRLQQYYDRAAQNAKTGREYDYDYSTALLTDCVIGDPGNLFYTQAFVENLLRKYSNKKVGALAGMRTAGSKTSMLNAKRKKDWLGVLRNGLEILKVNPRDASNLMEMAHACAELEFVDSEMVYLRTARDAEPKSFEIMRECALALEKTAQFDEAIAHWMAAEKLAKVASPEADEAHRAVSRLQVDLTMKSNVKQDSVRQGSAPGGSATGNQSATDHAFQAASAMLKPNKRSHAEEIEEKLAKNPIEVVLYSELAEIHNRAENWSEAESVLTRGLEATGGDLRLREQLEDIQIRRYQHNVFIAEKRAAELKTAEAENQFKQLAIELIRKEMEVYRQRVDRYPTNTQWKYELGIRLRRIGNYNEAIKLLQDARNDPKRRGVVLLDLGECFQHIKQFKLALQHYAQAAEAIPEKDRENRKKALYRAGVLAMGMAEMEKELNETELDDAEKFFSKLAALDYAYRDVSDRLDKIARLRDKGSKSESDS